jgi:hypothetical protein
MKKRLRKKLHKGEFQQYGISLMVPVSVENIETTLDAITDIADRYKILCCGGGLGRFVLPSEEHGELEIPSKVELLITTIAFGEEQLSDCIIGYFVNPVEKEISRDIADKVKAELESALKVEFKINCRIGLWN